jgi:hypothetical protein
MAETASDVIKDALQEITRLGAEAPVEPTDAQSAIRYMNRMMASMDADGIDLGYTEVSNLGDEITVPAGAIEAMVFNLAFRMWTQFEDGSAPPADLVMKARDGIKTMLNISFTMGQTEFPSTLPIGSGNEGNTQTDHFYSDLQDNILAETTGSVGLEEGTAGET